MVAREIAVKKYVVKLSADEREQLESLIHGGKHPAQKLTKARILLKVDASPAGEAKLIALACSEPPKGRARWTLRLLEDKVVELNIVERVSDNTIGRTLKKTFSNRT